MQKKIKEDLLHFITINYMVEKDEIELDKSLVDTGIIDSIGLVEISSYIEKKYLISILENEMNRNNFGSVNKIVEYIVRKINNE